MWYMGGSGARAARTKAAGSALIRTNRSSMAWRSLAWISSIYRRWRLTPLYRVTRGRRLALLVSACESVTPLWVSSEGGTVVL